MSAFRSDRRPGDVARLMKRTARDVDGLYDLVHSWFTDKKVDELCQSLYVLDGSSERAYIEARWESLCHHAVSYHNAYPHIYPTPDNALIYFALQALQVYNNTPMQGNRDDYDPSVRGAPSPVGQFVDSRAHAVIDITEIP